jgi:hypothetical protein
MNIIEEFPFLTLIRYQDTEKLCLVLNSDEKVLSYYDLDKIIMKEKKAKLLELGDTWWNESNRILPISVFLRDEMREFKKYIVTINLKDVEVISGPQTSLLNLVRKRVKKRQITLVKKVK